MVSSLLTIGFITKIVSVFCSDWINVSCSVFLSVKLCNVLKIHS